MEEEGCRSGRLWVGWSVVVEWTQVCCHRKRCRHARVPPDQTVDQLLGSSNLCWRNCLRDVQVSCTEVS